MAAWSWWARLIGVGLIDNSVVPIPGGMDLCVILLTSQHREWSVITERSRQMGLSSEDPSPFGSRKRRQSRNRKENWQNTGRRGLWEI